MVVEDKPSEFSYERFSLYGNFYYSGDTVTTEAVSIGSSCSGVVVLPCGSRLMQGTSLQTLNLTWRRNGEELTPDLDSEVSLSRFCDICG